MEIEADRAGAAHQHNFQAAPKVEGQPEEPTPQGGCSALSRNTASTTPGAKNRQPFACKVADVGAPGGRTSSGSSIVIPGPPNVSTTARPAPTAANDGETSHTPKTCRPSVFGDHRGGFVHGFGKVKSPKPVPGERLQEPRILPIMNDGPPLSDPAAGSRTTRRIKIEPEVRPAQYRDEPRRRSSIKPTGRGAIQGSSAFFARSGDGLARRAGAPSNGFLKASLNPSE